VWLETHVCIEPRSYASGVRQGCSLFPILFNLYVDDTIRQWEIEGQRIHLTQHRVFTLLFADDQVL